MHPEVAPPRGARLFAWGGAAVFVASLVFFLYSYTGRFGRPMSGDPGAGAVVWNIALFSLFALHHSLLARIRLRRWASRLWPQGLERSGYVWTSSLLFVAVCALWQPVPGVAWAVEGPALWILRALQLAGVWLTLYGAAIIDIYDLAGLRQAGAVGAAGTSGAEFKTAGPYGWVRHPIYTGWFLLVFAASPMTMTRLLFAAVSGVYLLLAIPLEERSLRATSGGAYERYMQRVRWRLVPGIY